MKNVAFYINPSLNWMGGVNYYKNLFKALSIIENKFNYYLFLPISAKKFSFENFFLHQIIYDDGFIKDFRFTLTEYINKYNIDILSHMNIFSDIFNCKIINWIPDFQHKYLNNFFTLNELKFRDTNFELISKYATKIILSSNTAKKDLKKFWPEYYNKSVILHFTPFLELDDLSLDELNDEKFFFIPNQFWQHKNHIVVFNAIKKLKDRGINVKLYCSGMTDDYRNKNHMESIYKYIKDNKLSENIIILGVIPYKELLQYMINSIAVINPSLFEGWSSTVEECKILEKFMIISDIEVHKEQNPNCIYFNPYSIDELSNILKELWVTNESLDKCLDIDLIKLNMINNLKLYAVNYEEILQTV